ncbi:MAG: hypothetical protein FWD79_10105 [Desulfobulbus sp.]|nr:hypothetical protein [Desulfobulbus sp.]
MNFGVYLKKHGLTKIKLHAKFIEAEWELQDVDREAAWELYIEMLTRIVTQQLPVGYGDEKTALNSVYSLFPITREILKRKGRKCIQFSKISIVVLNQVVRPFTAKWHKLSLENAFNDREICDDFRKELTDIRIVLLNYAKALADIAEVEDLTAISFDEQPI